ncbi:hypothetical protein DFJ77DRAFT_442600 [Powellomyces hirtus]|nr:hypothetical protein DFJ77DRAFT_442600 [Powellomyces hirtus]
MACDIVGALNRTGMYERKRPWVSAPGKQAVARRAKRGRRHARSEADEEREAVVYAQSTRGVDDDSESSGNTSGDLENDSKDMATNSESNSHSRQQPCPTTRTSPELAALFQSWNSGVLTYLNATHWGAKGRADKMHKALNAHASTSGKRKANELALAAPEATPSTIFPVRRRSGVEERIVTGGKYAQKRVWVREDRESLLSTQQSIVAVAA